MKLFRIPALLLAAALQLLPMCRTVCTAPAFSSTLAIIFRWTIGAGAALTAYDAYSAGSTVYIDSPTTAVGTVGVPFTYYITLGGKVGSDSGAIVAAVPLPAGLTNFTQHHLTSPNADWGVITGTPLSTMTNVLINLAASHPSYNGGVPVTGSLRLTVYPTSTPVVINTHPTNVIIATHNQSVSFNAAATGSGPLTYQWYKGDTNIWNHIPDATNATYTFNASTNKASGSFDVNSGNYLVKISGAAGIVASSPGTLIVNSALLAITAPPTNLTVNIGGTANFYVTASGTTTLGYQWYKNYTNRISGATASAYSISNAQSTNAGNFTVVVTNAAGALTSSIAVLAINASIAPDITTQPTNLTVTAGFPATFVVVASGAAPLSYQWQRSATNVSASATNSSWTIPNVRLADAGIYTVVVTNAGGSVTSSNAQLTANLPAAPALSSASQAGNLFSFTFTPAVGLTNAVLTNSDAGGAGWSVFTNIPPPVSATPVTVTDLISNNPKFYRVRLTP